MRLFVLLVFSFFTVATAHSRDMAGLALDTTTAARLHFIDVGSADAILVETRCGVTLVDTGGNRRPRVRHLMRYLRNFFDARPALDRRLDRLILSHSHGDHTGSARRIMKRYDVNELIWNGRKTFWQVPIARWLRRNPQQNHSMLLAPTGRNDMRVDVDTCDGGKVVYSYLWGAVPRRPVGWKRTDFADENNHSVVVRLDVAGSSALLTGDLERAGQRSLIATFGPRMIDVDLLKVSHHGYATGTSEAFVKAISPKVAVVMRGDRAWYDPTLKTYERLVEKSRRHPLAIRSWERTDVGRGRSRKFDRNGRRIRWGRTHGKFAQDTVNRAIYITAYDGTVVVDIKKNGTLAVDAELMTVDGRRTDRAGD